MCGVVDMDEDEVDEDGAGALGSGGLLLQLRNEGKVFSSEYEALTATPPPVHLAWPGDNQCLEPCTQRATAACDGSVALQVLDDVLGLAACCAGNLAGGLRATARGACSSLSDEVLGAGRRLQRSGRLLGSWSKG